MLKHNSTESSVLFLYCKVYSANDIPRLAAQLYLEYCAEKKYTPAYNIEGVVDHPNYYKLLADFSLYDSKGQYAPHQKVEYNMPDQVPYLDGRGVKRYMSTEYYIRTELQKELKVRDDIAERLADKSEDGIIPKFIKAVNGDQIADDGKMVGDSDNDTQAFYAPEATETAEWTKPITLDDVKVIKSIAEKRGRVSISELSSDEVQALQKWAYRYWANETTREKSPFFRAWVGDWRPISDAKVFVVDTKSDKRKAVKNDDTGWEIAASKKVHKETSHHSGSSEETALKYLPYIDDITKKAILVDTVLSDKDNENSVLFHTMYAYTEAFGYPALLRLTVEELFYYSTNESGTIKRDYILQNIKEESISKRNRVSSPNHLDQDSSTISIAELYDLVNNYGGKINYKPSSKIVNPDGTPRKMYHGTNAIIRIFDATKISDVTNRYIPAFYFTTEQRVAEKLARYRSKTSGGHSPHEQTVSHLPTRCPIYVSLGCIRLINECHNRFVIHLR